MSEGPRLVELSFSCSLLLSHMCNRCLVGSANWQGEAGKAADNDSAKLWHINIQIVSLDGGVDAHGVVGK